MRNLGKIDKKTRIEMEIFQVPKKVRTNLCNKWEETKKELGRNQLRNWEKKIRKSVVENRNESIKETGKKLN